MASHLGKHPRRLHVEPLEARRMLAVATVDTELDVIDFADGVTSLREAIFAANTLVGPDTIEFDPSLAGKTILLTQGEFQITDDLTINGLGAEQLTIDASGSDPTPSENNGDGSRIFNIDDGNNGNEIDVAVSGVTLTGGDIGGFSNDGGAIRNRENLTVSSTTISGNSTFGSFAEGGAIGSEYGNLTVMGSTISGNSTSATLSHGGGIFHRFGDLTVSGSTISGNFTLNSGAGGGIAISSGTNLTVTDSTISDNSTFGDGADGGGIYNRFGDVTVSGSTISGNSTSGDDAKGGGIYGSDGNLTVTNSTISGNSTSGSDAHGGGIYTRAYSTAKTTIISSTISGNSTADGRGGGLYSRAFVTTIQASTITGNTAPVGSGSGVASFGSGNRNEFSGSIVAGNTNEDVAVSFGITNSFRSIGFNLIGSGNDFDSGNQNALDPFIADVTSLTGVDPLLGPLQDNGGPTLTHALLPGSQAIDMGDPTFDPNDPDGDPLTDDAIITDQRGGLYTRVFGGRIDIGALESQPQHADFDGDGSVTGFDFLAWQRGFGTPAPLAVKDDGDADNDTDVDTDDLAAWENAYGVTGVAPLFTEIAVVGDDTAPLSHAQLVDLALAVHFSRTFALEENPSPSPSHQGRGTDSREEALAALNVSPRQDEDAAVVLAGEHRFGLAGDVAESYLSDQGLQSLDDVPLGGEVFPNL